MFSDRNLRLLLERLEAATRQFSDCWHFLVKANHPDWPDIPDPDDPDCVLRGLFPGVVDGIAEIAFGLDGQYSADPERRERCFLDLAWIVHEGHLYQAMLMDRRGGKTLDRVRLLDDARECYEREAGGATNIWPPVAPSEDCAPEMAAWPTLLSALSLKNC